MNSLHRTVPTLSLGFGFSFTDLYAEDRLEKIDAQFIQFVTELEPELAQSLRQARALAQDISAKAHSELLIRLAPYVDDFLAHLFGIVAELSSVSAEHHHLAPIFSVKRLFVQRKAMHKIKPDEALKLDGVALGRALEGFMGEAISELGFAKSVLAWQQDEVTHAKALQCALEYAAWAAHTAQGRLTHQSGVLFKAPHKTNPAHLVDVTATPDKPYVEYRFDVSRLRRREGFKLTDSGTDLTGALDQAHYCIWCHEQGKDSCSKGLLEKGSTGRGVSAFKKSPFGVTLAGCPLEEKISEFHKVKTEGHVIGALAIITVDNPLAAATGHRICNDCMKACIYQKQEAVDIPQAETRTLKDVLGLPWGFEIYSLLTRWNPLNIHQPLPRQATGKRVLVAGMGPAGFALSHYLLNEGHTVVGIDGLKIEPLEARWVGRSEQDQSVGFEPIYDVMAINEALDQRVMAGFGGVAEYGITVRWDKNFLKIIRLLIERRARFALLGGVRMGGTLTTDEVFDSGFDHLALAIGAGRPTVLDMPNALARGVRTASDFLMGLQLTGAAKADSITNLELRLPVVVIGGGLTAIDAATESMAYYPVQVEKFLFRYEALCQEGTEEAFNRSLTEEQKRVAMTYLEHARAIRAERAQAALQSRPPRIVELLQSWGGVTVAYRRRLIDSPAYTLNHEEVHKALEEGIAFAEALTPLSVQVDEFGHASSLNVSIQQRAEDGTWHEVGQKLLPLGCLLIAAGTQPNTVLAREEPQNYKLDGRYFQAVNPQAEAIAVEKSISKPTDIEVIIARRVDGRAVSYFGDVHPSYFGNVVKALASAKQGHPVVTEVLTQVSAGSPLTDAQFLHRMKERLSARVHAVNRLTPNIVEVVVRAPLAAERFEPGQFYRLQNFETLAPKLHGTRLAMEGLAMTGAWVDAKQGLISTIILEMGGSSNLCAQLKPGEPVILMGPTGAPTEIPRDQTVVLVGGGLGNAVLFSIGQAMRRAGNQVLYFAGYKKIIDRYKVEEIEAAADVVVWCCDEAPGFTPTRAQDFSFVGNIVQCMLAYATGQLGQSRLSMNQADRLIVIGSDRMMSAVTEARHKVLKDYVKAGHEAIGSINSPMQCMMKEICAQCLQPHVDPLTGKTTYVFSCFNQDQRLDHVDWPALNQRLQQNATQEKLTKHWLQHCLSH